ncbi:MAG: N-terminal phage integrase SAM-like domain-containing protein [Roseburia sp.]|nr:N-terminal phage integrase SAM-like domain-containing protein [Roseburia sp.]
MNRTKILELAGQLVLASVTGNDDVADKIFSDIADLIRTPNSENGGAPSPIPPPFEENSCGFLKFTDKEISKMPKSFRRTFIAEGKVICYRKRKRGNVYASFTYEARYRRHGFNISVSAKTLIELKLNFIQKLIAAELGSDEMRVPTNFDEFALYWFENFHKLKVANNTYDHNLKLYNRHIKQRFVKLGINKINAVMLRNLLNEFSDRGKTADDIHSILNQVLDCAVNHGLIKLNPLNMVYHESHIKQNGTAISIENERKVLNYFAGTEYEIYFAVIFYTGLRPCEYQTATIEGDFIRAVNKKRHKKRDDEIEYKFIPITPMLKPYLKDVCELHIPSQKIIAKKFKKVLPSHIPYDMRTTFQTRCDQCKISDKVIGLFMGNSIGGSGSALKKAYTDITDPDYKKYLFEEGQKLKY